MQFNVEAISNGILEFENVDVGVLHIPVHYTRFIVCIPVWRLCIFSERVRFSIICFSSGIIKHSFGISGVSAVPEN